MYNKHLCFLVYCLTSSLLFGQSMSEFEFHDDFDSLRLKKRWYYEITENNRYFLSKDGDSKQGRDGVLITEMNSTGVSGKAKRAEIVTKLFDSVGMHKYTSFSIKIPKSFKYDNANLGRETMVCQWHSKPEKGQDWSYYRKYNKFNRPSIALYLTTNDNKNFYFVLRYGNNGKPEFDEFGNLWSVIALKKIEQAKWYDFVFHIKWSFKNDGFISAWVNNKPFTPFNGLHNKIYGANMHNRTPVAFKMGQYRYFDDTNRHRVFYDDFNVGNSFIEVSRYESLPQMFGIEEELKFIENHK